DDGLVGADPVDAVVTLGFVGVGHGHDVDGVDVAAVPVLVKGAAFGGLLGAGDGAGEGLLHLVGCQDGHAPGGGGGDGAPFAVLALGVQLGLNLEDLLARAGDAGAGAHFGVRHGAEDVDGDAGGAHALGQAGAALQRVGEDGGRGSAVL